MSAITAASAISAITNHFTRKDRLNINLKKNRLKKELSADKKNILLNIETQINSGKLQQSYKKCPECHKNFSLIHINGITIDYCLLCKSLWFDFGELSRLSGFYPDVPAQHLAHRKSKYKCPICDIQMNEYIFKEKSNLLVDKCPENHGVYLENKEIERVFSLK